MANLISNKNSKNEILAPTRDDINNEVLKELLFIIPNIRKGFSISQILLTISFFVGIGLIILSVVLIFTDGVEWYFKLMFGGAGIVNTLGALIYYPIEKIQLSKGRLAVYQAVYASWLSDMFMSESSIKALHEGNSKLSVEDFVKLRESSTKAVKDLLILINPKSDINKLSEFFNSKSQKEK